MAVDRAEFNRLASALTSGRTEAIKPPNILPEGLLTLGEEERFRQFDAKILSVIDRVTGGLGLYVDVTREFNEPGESKYCPGLVKYKLSLNPVVGPVLNEGPLDENAAYRGDFLYNTARVLSEDPQTDVVSRMGLDKTFHNYDEELVANVTDFDLSLEEDGGSDAGVEHFSVDKLNLWRTDLDVSGLPSRETMVIDHGPFSDETLERYVFAVALHAVVSQE